eukprot:9590423-Alexandrium_andersonii.AAC.1
MCMLRDFLRWIAPGVDEEGEGAEGDLAAPEVAAVDEGGAGPGPDGAPGAPKPKVGERRPMPPHRDPESIVRERRTE